MNAATATRTRERSARVAEAEAHYRPTSPDCGRGHPAGAEQPSAGPPDEGLDAKQPPTGPLTGPPTGGLAERELTALWLLGRVPQELLPWPLLRAGRAGRGPGPDVREAVFVRAGVPVAGDVELHLRASDFHRHGHDRDRAYDGVALHLVWADDIGRAVPLAGGGSAPTVAVGPALRTAQRLRARLRGGPRLPPPCAAIAASRPAEEMRELVRAQGRRRLAERVWRAARIAERLGWDGAWRELRAAALRASAGRSRGRERPALSDEQAQEAAAEPWPLLESLARSRRPGALIAALRGPPLVAGTLGRGRAAELGWNAALPLLAARAAAYGDVELGRCSAALAAAWPAARPYGRTRALGTALSGEERTPAAGGALWAQGLLHLQDLWCERGGCGACPLSVTDSTSTRPACY